MENEPYETVNVWMRQNNLNPRQLIPALLRYDHRKSTEKSAQVGTAIFFYCVIWEIHLFIQTLFATLEPSYSIPFTCCHRLEQYRCSHS